MMGVAMGAVTGESSSLMLYVISRDMLYLVARVRLTAVKTVLVEELLNVEVVGGAGLMEVKRRTNCSILLLTRRQGIGCHLTVMVVVVALWNANPSTC